MHQVAFIVHMVPRFVTDFGAVARHCVARGIRTTIYSPATRSASRAGWAQPALAAGYVAALPAAAELRALPFDRERLGPFSLLRTMGFAWSLARRGRDATFVLWTVIPIIVCGLPLRVLRRRCVFLLTGLGSIFGSDLLRYRIARPVVRQIYRFLFSGPHSRVIVHNHEDKAFLCELGIRAGHVTVTPGCGVDPAEFPFIQELPRKPRKIILVPVRLLQEKGVCDAAAASAILAARGVDHEMWFSCSVDPGNPSSLTEEQISLMQRTIPSIRFVGYQPSLVPLYAVSDAVCIPTRYREGLPTALLEAAACGRPIVATDNVGCRDFVVDGETGLLAPRCSPNALADALARVLGDEALASRLRCAAYDRFRAGFTKAHMLAATIAVMRDLGLESAAPPAEPILGSAVAAALR